MLKVLWVCNVPIPMIADDMGVNVPNICGWLTGFANAIIENDDIELHISFPQLGLKNMKSGKTGKISYYAFSQPRLLGLLPVENQLNATPEMNQHIKQIIQSVNPDILHIFGTEYPHSLVAVEAFGKPDKTIVNIQGLPSFYWMHFNHGIPQYELKRFTLSNIIRGNLLKQAAKLRQRGIAEIEVIKKVRNVIGRTDWDEACTTQINSDIRYFFCNESLRDSFYDGIWSYEVCEKHSIFVSQAATPIKGIHFMIRAMPEIIREFPDTHLYVAGNNPIKTDTIYEKLKISSYALYLKSLIKKFNLEDKITFVGNLNEIEMKSRFLKSNVFISPSSIENSPNSLGEAMILGVPCISSDVGGVKNLIEHQKEGFIYQSDAPYMISYYVKKYFKHPDLAKKMGSAAQFHALSTHSRNNNLKTLLNIYKEISDEENN